MTPKRAFILVILSMSSHGFSAGKKPPTSAPQIQTPPPPVVTTPAPPEAETSSPDSSPTATTPEVKQFGLVFGAKAGANLPLGEPTGNLEDVMADPLWGYAFSGGARIGEYLILALDLNLYMGTIVYTKTTGQKTWYSTEVDLSPTVRVYPFTLSGLPVSLTATYGIYEKLHISKYFTPMNANDEQTSSYGGKSWGIGAGYDVFQSDPMRLGLDVGYRSHRYDTRYFRKDKDSALESESLPDPFGYNALDINARFIVVL